MPKNDCKPLPEITQADIVRFWSKVDTKGPDECWPWKKSKDRYGKLYIKHQRCASHRVAYFLHYGIDPYPLLVCHTCDNTMCCNGAHLFKGTNQQNTADRHAKGRTAKGNKSGAAKLKQVQVDAIRAAYAAGGITQPTLAKQYGLSLDGINRIIRHCYWKPDHKGNPVIEQSPVSSTLNSTPNGPKSDSV